MKIGIDASRFKDKNATGTEWYSHHIIKNLVELKREEDEITLYLRETLDDLEGRVEKEVIDRKRLWSLLGLSKEMRKGLIDCLFVPSHVLPLTMPKRSIITIHDTAFRHLRVAYSFFQYHYLNWSTKFAVKHAWRIIVPSEATKKDLVELFGCSEEKIRVVNHGYEKPEISAKAIDQVFENSEVFKYFGISKKTKYFLFVGRLESKKNLVRVVKAFKRFLENKEDFKLVLAGGRGVGFDEILKCVDELKLVGKVVMPGYITEKEKAALFEHCQGLVFPSLYEGFGFPVLEAFSYGKPVLTSHVSCLPEVAGEAAHYCDPFDESSILMGMEKIVNDEGYRDDLVEKGWNRVEGFNWNKAAMETYKIIRGDG